MAFAAAATCFVGGNVAAFEINAGNPDLAVRWDNIRQVALQRGATRTTDRHTVRLRAVFLQGESYRYPEGRTYLGPADFVFEDPSGQF